MKRPFGPLDNKSLKINSKTFKVGENQKILKCESLEDLLLKEVSILSLVKESLEDLLL